MNLSEVEQMTAARKITHVDDDRFVIFNHDVTGVEVEVDTGIRVRNRLKFSLK